MIIVVETIIVAMTSDQQGLGLRAFGGLVGTL